MSCFVSVSCSFFSVVMIHYSVVASCCRWQFVFFKQKTAYEMRMSDWSSDVCSSDLLMPAVPPSSPGAGGPVTASLDLALATADGTLVLGGRLDDPHDQTGRAACRERACQYV